MTRPIGRALVIGALAMLAWPLGAVAGSGTQSPDPAIVADQAPAATATGLDLFLAVSVNGVQTELVAAFHQDADGTLSIEATQLRNVGILPQANAKMANGHIRIDRLASVRYVYDELNQSIAFTAGDGQRAPRIVDAKAPKRGADKKQARLQAQSSYGALMNYSLRGTVDNSGSDERYAVSGVSGTFEARAFGPMGVVTNSFIASTSDSWYYDSTRLESTWSYSDESSMITYNAGDIITGGLGWTRSSRLGGVQIQRNFDLRSDLVTFPVPSMSGSAAVPSTVDVYLDNARRFTSQVDSGPFEVTNLPIVDGTGTARVVVTDAQGNEVTTESDFIASNKLLSPGLQDFSAEVGFARLNYGVSSNDYDQRPYASATARSGITRWMTLEGHAEGGEDLLNGGFGAVFASRLLGVVSISAAGSLSTGEPGRQLGLSLERDFWGVHLNARLQRSFGNYQDIASITADDQEAGSQSLSRSSDPPRALEQISASVPLRFDESNINFSYTHYEYTDGDESRILGISYNRPVFNGSTFSVSAIKDFEDQGFGLYASLIIPIGAKETATTSVSNQDGDLSITERVTHSQGQQIGDYGWSVARQQSDDALTSASASYRTPAANVTARVDVRDDSNRATINMDGAVVASGGGVFVSNQIHDAFAVVDAGAPGVEVQYENRPVGVTNSAGKLLLPRLRSYESNRISIDPTNLPLDAVVNNTRDVVMPADRSGVVVKFDVDTDANAALVSFTMPNGEPVQMGAIGKMAAQAEPFIIGYDGQALVENLVAVNHASITLRDGSVCVATFRYKADPGKQVSIRDAICQP
ncbi:fimbrial biogenesis outer membrane usher protein [Rhizobium sp. CG5]|uniref:fimbria/pilus outer membrane usher protein n=1 Tax=Rhizobium sp. CG5 TaxID=2726076 RepID=UPI0020339E98|nr:fimbrial biogenesis outer membrane usher protein [Rhizobium sp. CG5]